MNDCEIVELLVGIASEPAKATLPDPVTVALLIVPVTPLTFQYNNSFSKLGFPSIPEASGLRVGNLLGIILGLVDGFFVGGIVGEMVGALIRTAEGFVEDFTVG